MTTVMIVVMVARMMNTRHIHENSDNHEHEEVHYHRRQLNEHNEYVQIIDDGVMLMKVLIFMTEIISVFIT